ncbi:MAG: esterase-like activity of phytase family protein, partial [Bacteroidia bacterium]|nr:esterase-like activity of phytase family protein [Bacteroidia bacterium]
MKRILLSSAMLLFLLLQFQVGKAQISLIKDYQNFNSPQIGTFQGINFREAGFSGLYPIPGTNGKEYWTITDRGVNVDAANANPSGCRPTYDKIYGFPSYAPKIMRIRVNGDSIQILQIISMKRPNGTGATGLINPTGLGSTAAEIASTDTVLDCTRFNLKTTAKDTWGIDAEGVVVDKEGNFWICEEGGPTIWKLNSNGVVLKRYTPYANLPGVRNIDVQIDTCFKYRKNNRGFEGIAITPNGKIYAIIQSPLLFPTKTIGEGTRLHRILEIDPVTNANRMFVYVNDGIIGASGSNQIRLRDWKIGDMAAINDSTFLVLEAALRGTTDIKKMYQININGATNVSSGLYTGKTLEALVDSVGLLANNIKAVKKTLFMNLLTNGWPASLEKAEGLAIVNDSTIAIVNDNDYGQVSVPENGIAAATTFTSHLFTYSLKGSNKLVKFVAPNSNLKMGITGPSTSKSPYLRALQPDAYFTSILTAGETVGGYKMAGIPDGAGALDNGDGTFTFYVNHEIPNSGGVVRAHGQKGAFVSQWKINKSDLSVISGTDLIKNVYLWSNGAYVLSNSANLNSKAVFSRFCSGDLPALTAFYNPVTGLGTTERIFMNGEETGSEGRGFGHILTGTNAGTSYELPYLGKFSWENSVANPVIGNKTIVVGTDDATPGQVYAYVGTKTNTGTEIDKAGLNNGKLFGVAVAGLTAEVSGSFPAVNTTFTMVDIGNIKDSSGAFINTKSNTLGVTNFLRPEDGTWDPSNAKDFYFVTTNGFTAPSRLWRLRFNDIQNPENGGTITVLLDGTEGPKMMDNIGIDNSGHLLIQEDVGNNAHNGKIWQYNTATDALKLVADHDPTRFEVGGSSYVTQDEESSGIFDAQSLLGPGMHLLVDQAHYSISGEVYEGGQFLAFYNPETAVNNPEIAVTGNSVNIADGNTAVSVSDNTDFGRLSISQYQNRTFVLKNTGTGDLAISHISFGGAIASDFSLASPAMFPIVIAPNSSYNLMVKFMPQGLGLRNATLYMQTTDVNEDVYNFAIGGFGLGAGVTG